MKKIIFTLIVLATLVACKKNEPDSLFDKTPSERFEESQAELRKELTTAQQGWKLTYFTKEGTYAVYAYVHKPGSPKGKGVVRITVSYPKFKSIEWKDENGKPVTYPKFNTYCRRISLLLHF